MSRIPKWKVEKAKVKVVFRLQFHATNIPQPGWDKLFLSFIPADIGKATAKTTKANVRNGNCKWSDPIYETTRLLQDMRSRLYDEKLYRLVVAMGSSRSSILGEVTINLSDFVDALKPSLVTLPLHGSDHGTILHITVQLLTSKTGFREFEQQRELSVKGFQTASGQRSRNPSETAAASLEMTHEQLDKVNNARVRFKGPMGLPSREEIGKSSEDYDDSAVVGFDGSSNTSESLYAEKNEISSIHEVESLKSIASGDMSILPTVQSPRTVKGDMHDFRLLKQGSNDWIHGWNSDYSVDNDISAAHEENNRLKVILEGVESGFLQLKAEANSLQTLTNELGAETHNLTEQFAIEVASGEKLSKEVSVMKSECKRFKQELQELKSTTTMQCVSGKTTIRGAEWHQSLILLEKKIREIQNKACLQYHGDDFNFLSSEFDVLHCIIENLKQETSCIDIRNPDSELHSLINSPELEKNSDGTIVIEEKICELIQKLEELDAEKGILTKKMYEMEHYYETLIQELEESRHQTGNELGNLKAEHSSCIYTISALQNQIEKLQVDMNEQFIRFSGDKNDLDSLNKDLEKRAITSETAFKRVRLNYAIAVDRLQKDLELLSFQVLSMHETNENLAKHALIDVSQVFPHQYPEINPGVAKKRSDGISTQTDCEKSMLVNGDIIQRGLTVNEWNTHKHQLKPESIETSPQLVTYSPNQNVNSNNQIVSDNIDSGETKRFLHVLPKLQEDTETELSEIHMLNMHWEVFTEVLKDAIYNVHDGVVHMKKEIVKLTQQIEYSNSEKESLMFKSRNAFDDIRKMRKDEANYQSKCDDLTLKNHILEAKIKDAIGENNSLTQKIAEYECKYKHCLEERNELEDKFKSENLQRNSLEKEITSTIKNLKALKEEYDNLSALNFELQNTQNYLQNKLVDLCNNMVSFYKVVNNTGVDSISLEQDMKSNNYMSIVLHLQVFQREAYKKILQLCQEKEEIKEDRDVACCSLKKKESEFLDRKQHFESELEELRMKLVFSNALVEKLELEIQDVTNKLKISLEAEETQKCIYRELSAKLTILEIEIQQANDENKDISQKILDFDRVKEELEKTKLSLMDCMQENRVLISTTESGKTMSIQLENELSNLNERLKCSEENLQFERVEKEKLEATIAGLTLQLKDKDQQLLSCDAQKSDIISSSKRVMELETEMQHLLLNCEKIQRKQDDEISTLNLKIADMDRYLAEFLDLLLSAEVKLIYLTCQFQIKMEEFAEQRKVERSQVAKLLEKNTYKIATETQRADEIRIELDLANALIEKLQLELQDITNRFKFSVEIEEEHKSTNRELHSKLAILETEIQRYKDENSNINQKVWELECVKEELDRAKLNQQELADKLQLSIEAEEKHMSINGDLSSKLAILENETQQTKNENMAFNEKVVELECTQAELERTKLTLQDVDNKLQLSIQAEEKRESMNKELISKISTLETELQKSKDENMYVIQLVEELKCIKEELEKSKLTLADYMQEKKDLMMLIGSGKEVTIQLENELSNLKDCLKCADDNLHLERECREQLEAAVADLNLQLKEKDQQLFSCDEHISELSFVKKRVIDLETELQDNLLNSNERQSNHENKISELHIQISDLEYHLLEILTDSLSADAKLTYLTCQYQLNMDNLVEKIKTVQSDFEELQSKHTDVINSLKNHIVTEAELSDENVRLFTALQSVKAELEVIINEKNSVLADLNDIKSRAAMLEVDNSREKHNNEDLEEEVDNLRFSKLELETVGIILKSKMNEQQAHMSLLEEFEYELKILREQHNELTYKLSEQILKTEEFKNLSIHLRELKDKAEAECLQARERREAQGSSLALQDSLRIAFIKEQCESKLQEMKNQLVSSQKYAEEMLLKLQTALDEIETGKRNEASLIKKFDELSMKMSDIEAELQTVAANRRELAKASDRMKAELECTILSLDCCKEEKVKLEASLQESNKERTRLRVELDLVKRLLGNMASTTDVEIDKIQDRSCSGTSIGELLEDGNSQTLIYLETTVPTDVSDHTDNSDIVKLAETSQLLSSGRELQHVPPAFVCGTYLQDAVVTGNSMDKEMLLENSTKHIADMKEHFKEQKKLLTSMDHLHKKLEKLKNDNLSSIIPIEDNHDLTLEGLQYDLSQLDKANEHLQSIFPVFKEISGSGNALERILALELELADALQEKNKDTCFQSSFLKQHNDDKAVFKSFRDINDLIKDMLEMKKRNAAVETELKEMHARYSQLSLQFAEVEGERQQLVMSLKNKSPRKS